MYWISPALRQEPMFLLAGLGALWLLTLYLAFTQGRARALHHNHSGGDAAGAGDVPAAEAPARPVLGSAEVAAKVYDSAMSNFYAVMLDEAAKGLSEFGYTVVAGWQGQHTLTLPDSIRDAVARRVQYRREAFIAPMEDDDDRRSRVDRNIREGYSQLILDELILGWSKAGVYVVAPDVVPAFVPAMAPAETPKSVCGLDSQEVLQWLENAPLEAPIETGEAVHGTPKK